MKFVLIKKRGIAKFFIVLIALALAIAGVAFTGSAQVYKGLTGRKMPIYSVQTNEKVVALSFDACWGNENTKGILEALAKHEAVATYFVVGSWAEQYSDDLKTLAESERVEIGTHSNTHTHMAKLSAKKIELELGTSSAIIEQITGKKPSLFRAPYGEYSDTLINTAEKIGLKTIQWDIDSTDDGESSAMEIASKVLSNVKSGSIILFHDDGKNTLQALPAIIEGLKNKGYSFKTIGDMIYKDNYTIDTTGKQIRR